MGPAPLQGTEESSESVWNSGNLSLAVVQVSCFPSRVVETQAVR